PSFFVLLKFFMNAPAISLKLPVLPSGDQAPSAQNDPGAAGAGSNVELAVSAFFEKQIKSNDMPGAAGTAEISAKLNRNTNSLPSLYVMLNRPSPGWLLSRNFCSGTLTSFHDPSPLNTHGHVHRSSRSFEK